MLSAYYTRLYSELIAADVARGLRKSKAYLMFWELRCQFVVPTVDALYFAFAESLLPEDAYAGPVGVPAGLEREVVRCRDLAVPLHLVVHAIRMQA